MTYVLVDLLNDQVVGTFPSEDAAWEFAFDPHGLAWGPLWHDDEEVARALDLPTEKVPHTDPSADEFKKDARVLPLLTPDEAHDLWMLRREHGADEEDER